jgi:hypothetical protein
VSRMMNMGGQIGGALAPTAFGILVTRGSWIAALVVAACLLFLGAGIWAFWINPEVSVIDKGRVIAAPRLRARCVAEPNALRRKGR